MSEKDNDAQKANESLDYICTISKRIYEDAANYEDQNFATTSDLQSCQNEFKCSNMNCCSTLADFDDDDEDEDLSDTPNGYKIELWECEKRHSGDGEEYPETTVESKLDDDEDKMNPAYIPRKGTFFEHDLRNDCRESETEFKLKKIHRIDRTKWQHDKFDEKFQAPKSRQEIVAVYGFDIREDCLPLEIPKKSNKHRIGKKAQPEDAFREWIRADKPRNDYSEKTFCPRRSWPDVTLRIQKERTKQPPYTIAKSTTDVAFANSEEKNESYLNPEIEYLNSAVKDNDLQISEKNHLENIKDSSKSAKIGTGRILCENLEGIQTHSSRSSDKHSRKISAKNADRKQNIIYPSNHKNKYIGHVCEDRSILNDLPASTAAVSQSTQQPQDVRLLERKELLTTLHGYDFHKKVSCGSKRSTIIIQTTMTPEIIPPVTCIRTNSKSAEAKSVTALRSNNTALATLVNANVSEEPCIWPGREFVPSEYLYQSSKSDIKTKRYSSQRLKMTSPESDLPETESRDADCGDNNIALLPDLASMNAPVINGPYQTTAYYGALSAPRNMLHFPESAVLPFAVPSINYTIPVNSSVLSNQLRLYNSPAIKSKTMSVAPCATALMHGAYVNSQALLTGTYVNSPVFNYGGTLTQRYSFATVENPSGSSHPARRKINEGGNPLEVRGGTVYFNPEIQQVDLLHGTTYFNTEEQAPRLKSPIRRAKAAIPIVKPKDLAEKEIITTANEYKVMQQQMRNTDATLPTEKTDGENRGDDTKDNATLNLEETEAKEENENEAKHAT